MTKYYSYKLLALFTERMAYWNENVENHVSHKIQNVDIEIPGNVMIKAYWFLINYIGTYSIDHPVENSIWIETLIDFTFKAISKTFPIDYAGILATVIRDDLLITGKVRDCEIGEYLD